MKLKVKKGATVEVVAGADKGKQGKVLGINKSKLKIRVEGIKVMTHFDKKEGLQKKEGFIDYSNVKLVGQPQVDKKKPVKKKSTSRKTA